jgi:hypothetical protein
LWWRVSLRSCHWTGKLAREPCPWLGDRKQQGNLQCKGIEWVWTWLVITALGRWQVLFCWRICWSFPLEGRFSLHLGEKGASPLLSFTTRETEDREATSLIPALSSGFDAWFYIPRGASDTLPLSAFQPGCFCLCKSTGDSNNKSLPPILKVLEEDLRKYALSPQRLFLDAPGRFLKRTHTVNYLWLFESWTEIEG